jgi:hypothetical protein
VAAEASFRAEGTTEDTKAVSARIRAADRVGHRWDVARKEDAAAGKEQGQVRAHVEQLCGGRDRLRERGDSVARDISKAIHQYMRTATLHIDLPVVGERVQAGAGATLVGRLRVLVWVRRLGEALEARDGRRVEVLERVRQAVCRRVGRASTALKRALLRARGARFDVGVEVGSVTLLLRIERADELRQLRVAPDHLERPREVLVMARAEGREGRDGRRRAEDDEGGRELHLHGRKCQ